MHAEPDGRIPDRHPARRLIAEGTGGSGWSTQLTLLTPLGFSLTHATDFPDRIERDSLASEDSFQTTAAIRPVGDTSEDLCESTTQLLNKPRPAPELRPA